MNKARKLWCKLFCGVFENVPSFHPHFCELKLMRFYRIPVATIAKRFRMDEADTWLFKEQDKWARQLSPSPAHQGTLENSTWHEDSTVLLNNLQFDPIVPQWGRQATAHSRVIDWINSLIPNRWIEYWCLVSPDHKRKTQSASTAQRFNPLSTLKLQFQIVVL